MNIRKTIEALVVAGGLTILAGPASAAIVTYNVNLTFDPNASPSSSLGAAGPGTVTGTITIDTSLPVTAPPGNLIAVNLVERSNNGTILSGFSNSPSQLFDTVTPYTILFIGSPITEYPAASTLVTNNSVQYERVDFSSPPVIDSIQEGPWIQFDFPYPSGGAVIPGNFDSIASTGFNAYLYGTVTPVLSAVPEPTTWAMMALGFAGLGFAGFRKARRAVDFAA